MGFMDKAKKLADQAQQKIDQTQKGFNENQAQKAGGGGAPARYDSHGRPVGQDAPPPAATTPPPSGEPVHAGDSAPGGDTGQAFSAPAPVPPAQPAAAPEQAQPPAPSAEQAPSPPAEVEQPPPVQGQNNSTPDPFKPIQ